MLLGYIKTKANAERASNRSVMWPILLSCISGWSGQGVAEAVAAWVSYEYMRVMGRPMWGLFSIRDSSLSPCSYQIRTIADAHAPGIQGTFSLPPWVSDPDMHDGTCVTHVPSCMPGSLTSGFLWSRWRGKTFPAFPAHAQPTILRIWQEAHWGIWPLET